MVKKAWRQKQSSRSQEAEMDAGIDSFSPFYPTQDPSPLNGAANIQVGLSPGNSLTNMPTSCLLYDSGRCHTDNQR